MSHAIHDFAEGDRVRVRNRPQFPNGAILKLMELGYVLIRWDSNVLETVHYAELEKVNEPHAG